MPAYAGRGIQQEEVGNVDPFVSTIIKQGLVAGAIVGLLVAGVYIFVQYSKLQHALTLNMAPPQLP